MIHFFKLCLVHGIWRKLRTKKTKEKEKRIEEIQYYVWLRDFSAEKKMIKRKNKINKSTKFIIFYLKDSNKGKKWDSVRYFNVWVNHKLAEHFFPFSSPFSEENHFPSLQTLVFQHILYSFIFSVWTILFHNLFSFLFHSQKHKPDIVLTKMIVC